MAININWYKALPEEERQGHRNDIEKNLMVAEKLHEQAKKAYTLCMEDEKPSSSDIATVIRHMEKCKEEIKDLQDDLGKISAYSSSYGYGEPTYDSGGCGENDPYVALNSILNNGVSHIRPEELCQHPVAGTQTFKHIFENRRKEKEAQERSKWVTHHTEFSRPAKKEELPEKREARREEFIEKKEEREQQKEKEKEQKAKGA